MTQEYSDPITSRVRQFITYKQNAYATIQAETGVDASRWKNLQHGNTKAIPVDMLHSLYTRWPEHVLWFSTGRTDQLRGHTSPLPVEDTDEEDSAAERLYLAAKLVWGETASEMERISGVPAASWDALSKGNFEIDARLVALLMKGGGPYVNWVISGHPDTYFQLSAKDNWAQKLARGLGADLEGKPGSPIAKIAKAVVRSSTSKR